MFVTPIISEAVPFYCTYAPVSVWSLSTWENLNIDILEGQIFNILFTRLQKSPEAYNVTFLFNGFAKPL